MKAACSGWSCVALGQALDGRDLAPLHEGGEREARFHALAVHQHRAGAALAEAAAFLRAGEMQVLAQGVEQRGARIERQPMLGSVDAQHDVERSGRRVGALRRRRRYGSRHELSSYKSAAGHRGQLPAALVVSHRSWSSHPSRLRGAGSGGRSQQDRHSLTTGTSNLRPAVTHAQPECSSDLGSQPTLDGSTSRRRALLP